MPIWCGMQARGIADIRIVGGHPALDLVNTVGARRGRTGADYLATYDDLLLWATRQGVLDGREAVALGSAAQAEPAAAATALLRAKRLRECLWRVWTAIQGREGPAEADLALLTREVIAAQRARVLEWSDVGCTWRWTDVARLDAVTARVASAAAELLAGGEHLHLSRVRECEGRNCGWLFLDATRNGTRRWCTAEECGSLARVTRFRAKRKAAPRTG